jgi:hypothetical protein
MPGALQLILGVVLLWLALGLAGVFFPRNLHLVSRVLFPAGAARSEGPRMNSACA